MSIKDYYKVLEINPSASATDVKKSYRRLAHKYHPYKNFGNKIFELKFREIQEAYKVLSDDKKRQEYNYKRFDQLHGLNQKRYEQTVTAGMILQRTKDLRKRIAQLDPDRMNRDSLYIKLQDLLSNSNIKLINHSHDQSLSHQVIDNILAVAKPLDFHASFQIAKRLQQITYANTATDQRIQRFLREQQLHSFWQKYQFLVAFIVALLMCFLIYVIST